MSDLSALSDEELTNQYQSLSDDDLKAAYNQSQPQQDLSSVSDDDLMKMYQGMSDDELKQAYNQPQPEGMLGTAAREAAHGVLPLMGGVATGAATGALAGSVFGPPGAIVGGLAGMVGGSMLTNRAQDAVLKAGGIEDDQQRQVNAAENPWSSFAGGLAPAIGNPAGTLAQRGFGAGAMGLFEAGQQYLNEGHIDPAKVAAAAAFGAAVPNGNFATRYAHGLGANAAGKIAGRPDMKPGDTAGAGDKADVDINQSPNVAGNQATDQQPAAEPKAYNPDAQVAGTKVKADGGENALKPRTTKDLSETPFGGTDDPNPVSDPTLAAGVKGSVGDEPPVVGDNGFPEPPAQQAAPPPPAPAPAPPPTDRQAAIRAQLDQMPPRDPRRKALVDEHNQLALQNRKQQAAAPPPVEQTPAPPVEQTAPPVQAEAPPVAQRAALAEKPTLTLPKKAAKVEAPPVEQPVEAPPVETKPDAAPAPETKSEIPPLDQQHALTLQRLLDNGWNEMAVHYANATPEDRALMQPHIDEGLPQTTKHGVNRRATESARMKNDIGQEARTKPQLEQQNSAIRAIRKAFADHPPVEGETTEQLIKRLQAAVDTAHTAHGSNPLDRVKGYLPREKPPEFEWFKHLQDNAARKPIYFDTAGKLEAFKAEEDAIRSKLEKPAEQSEYPIKDPKKMDAGIEKSRRGGAVAEAQLEKQSETNDPRESIDEMIDIKRKLEEAGKSPDDIEAIMKHIETEEEETSGPRPTKIRIKTREQIKKLEAPRGTLDTLAEKTALPPTNEVRRGDIAGVNNDPERLAKYTAMLEQAKERGESRSRSLAQFIKAGGDAAKDMFGNERGGGDPRKIGEDIGKLFKGTTSIVSRAINNMLKAIREAHPEAPPPGAKISGKKVYDEPVGPKMARYIAKDIEGNEPAKAGYTIADRMNEAAKTDNSISAESMRLREDIERRLRGETSYGDTLKRKVKEGVQNKLAELKGTRADIAARDAMQERTKDMYNALETGDRSLIKTEGDQKIFDELLQKQMEVEFIRRQIHEKQANGEWGWVDIGRETEDGVHRRWKNGGELPAVDQWGAHPDPVAGNNPLSTRRGPMTMERPLVVAEGKNGERHIIHLETGENGKFNGKWSVWKDYKNYDIKDAPDVTFKQLGDTFKLGKREFTLRDATTGEIEHNVLGNDGKPMEAQRDAVASILSSHDYHLKLFNHLQTMADMIDNPKSNAGAAFRKYATDIGGHAQVQNGEWKKSTTPGFERFWMEDHLREALEDAHQPGINDDALNILRRVSRAGMQTIFWNPVVHLMNVAPHWAVGRGSKWAMPSGYKDLFETGAQAIKTVLSNDQTHQNIRQILAENGYGGIYDGVIAQNSTRKLSLGLGEEIARNPKKWGPIADKLDMTVGDLVRSVYTASKNIMWSGNDMMLTQTILEHLRDMGVKDITQASKAEVKQAIEKVEQHFPNYRIPGRTIGSGQGGRAISKGLGDALFTAFGRYGYGMFNSHANLVASVLKGSGPERKEAIGQLMVLGALVYAVHPLYNAFAKTVTGNDQAESRPRGPLTIPGHLAQARDTGDIAPVVREALRASPLLSTAFEVARQKDFGGKDISSPAAVRRALGAEGAAAMPGGLANVALHTAGHIASNLVAPLGTVNQALNNQGLAAGARDQLLDIKSPSTAEQKFRNQVPRTSAREERYRNIRKKSLADKLLNAFN